MVASADKRNIRRVGIADSTRRRQDEVRRAISDERAGLTARSPVNYGFLVVSGAGAGAAGGVAPGCPGSGTADGGCCAAFVESATVRMRCARSSARSTPAAFTL